MTDAQRNEPDRVVVVHLAQEPAPLVRLLAQGVGRPLVFVQTRSALAQSLTTGPTLVFVDATQRPRKALALCRAAAQQDIPVVVITPTTQALVSALATGAGEALSVDTPLELAQARLNAFLQRAEMLAQLRRQVAEGREAAETAQQLKTRLDLIATVAANLSRATEIIPMLDEFAERLLAFLPFDSLGFLWRHSAGYQFVAYSHWYMTRTRLAVRRRKAIEAFRTLVDARLDTSAVAVRCRSNEFDTMPLPKRAIRTRAYHMPMVAGEHAFGIVQLCRSETAAFTAHDLSLFATVVEQLSVAVHNLLLVDQTREMAITDETTRLYNRRHLRDILQREFDRAARYGKPLSVIMIDIDYFKRINDTWGHQAGDDVLRALGAHLRAGVRAPDIVFRYGGEEFLILLPDTRREHAIRIAQRLLRTVAQTRIETASRTLRVTLSAGVAGLLPGTMPRPEDLVAAADKALYTAKETGRNRVCF